jgi:hypothetical protein
MQSTFKGCVQRHKSKEHVSKWALPLCPWVLCSFILHSFYTGHQSVCEWRCKAFTVHLRKWMSYCVNGCISFLLSEGKYPLVPYDAVNRNKVSICQLPLFIFSSHSLHVSAPTGHPQVRHTIRCFQGPFLPQRIRCTYTTWRMPISVLRPVVPNTCYQN